MSRFQSREETLWSFALYGTAVSARTLFLSTQLDSAGVVVLFITVLIVWFLAYWPHKALCQFILSSKTSAGEGIAGVVTHYYGKKIGSLITTLHSIAFFVVVLIYAVAITNSLTEQLVKHITINLWIRMLVDLDVVLVLSLIFLTSRQAIIRVMGFLVFPLIAYFLFFSLYLTGSWWPTLLTGQTSSGQHMLHRVRISTPVMVFASNHTPTISTLAIDRREKYGEQAMGRCKKIMKVAYVIICLSILFFVFNYLLLILTNYIESAKDEGVTILSALSMVLSAPVWLSTSGIIIAVVVMSESFLDAYLSVIEGAMEVAKTSLHQVGAKRSWAFNHAPSIMFVSAIMFTIYCTNPNAVSMIYVISDPLTAMTLFTMLTLFTYLIPALRPYRSVGNLITLIVDLLCISVVSFGQNMLSNGSFQQADEPLSWLI